MNFMTLVKNKTGWKNDKKAHLSGNPLTDVPWQRNKALRVCAQHFPGRGDVVENDGVCLTGVGTTVAVVHGDAGLLSIMRGVKPAMLRPL